MSERLDVIEAEAKGGMEFEALERLLVEEEPKIMKSILDETIRDFPPSDKTS